MLHDFSAKLGASVSQFKYHFESIDKEFWRLLLFHFKSEDPEEAITQPKTSDTLSSFAISFRRLPQKWTFTISFGLNLRMLRGPRHIP